MAVKPSLSFFGQDKTQDYVKSNCFVSLQQMPEETEISEMS